MLIVQYLSSVVSELFWTTVDLLGLKHYFQNVARHKRRLASTRCPDNRTGSDASAVDGDAASGGQADIDSSDTVQDSCEEGATFALILHRLEVGADWGRSWWVSYAFSTKRPCFSCPHGRSPSSPISPPSPISN